MMRDTISITVLCECEKMRVTVSVTLECLVSVTMRVTVTVLGECNNESYCYSVQLGSLASCGHFFNIKFLNSLSLNVKCYLSVHHGSTL